jgi:hypothetical protein
LSGATIKVIMLKKVIKDIFSRPIYFKREEIHILEESILVAPNFVGFSQGMSKKDYLKKRKESRKYHYVLYQQSNLAMRGLNSVLEVVNSILNFI